jgi:hypothetical protein
VLAAIVSRELPCPTDAPALLGGKYLVIKTGILILVNSLRDHAEEKGMRKQGREGKLNQKGVTRNPISSHREDQSYQSHFQPGARGIGCHFVPPYQVVSGYQL